MKGDDGWRKIGGQTGPKLPPAPRSRGRKLVTLSRPAIRQFSRIDNLQGGLEPTISFPHKGLVGSTTQGLAQLYSINRYSDVYL